MSANQINEMSASQIDMKLMTIYRGLSEKRDNMFQDLEVFLADVIKRSTEPEKLLNELAEGKTVLILYGLKAIGCN